MVCLCCCCEIIAKTGNGIIYDIYLPMCECILAHKQTGWGGLSGCEVCKDVDRIPERDEYILFIYAMPI